MFSFRGPILTSKSWLNRALVVEHFNKNLKTNATTDSDDVVYLKRAIESVDQTKSFDLGLGGTSFRFFAFLISRHPGHWVLKAHQRLLERPQQEINLILNQLGVKAEFIKNELHIDSQGWQNNGKINCAADVSSQFVSGLLLSCWNLSFDLEIEIKKPISSASYLQMTIELLRQAGMNVQTEENEAHLYCRIPKNQKSQISHLEPELDISSAFSLISAAVLNGEVKITNWQNQSSQPDLVFLDIFKKMNISFFIQEEQFSITKHNNWKAIEYNLNNSPDLFPVLAILCAFADGVSTLFGAGQLKFKESNRIEKTQELLKLAGFKTEVLNDGLLIYGKSSTQDLNKKLKFNPDHDHRMAMAAGLLRLKGYNIEIEKAAVVNKSYPNFWKDIGLHI